jgi:hypothetical protein
MRVVEIVQGQKSRVAEFGRAMKTAVYEIGWIRGPSRIHTKNKRYMKLEIVESACTLYADHYSFARPVQGRSQLHTCKILACSHVFSFLL